MLSRYEPGMLGFEDRCDHCMDFPRVMLLFITAYESGEDDMITKLTQQNPKLRTNPELYKPSSQNLKPYSPP